VYTSSPTTAFSNPRPAYDYPDVRPKYSFEYAVSDFSNNFGHSESRDGHKTTGTYRVLLPDSRTQIVTYTADENGYVADVRYEGQAVYPTEFKPVFGTESGPAYPDTTAPAPRPSHISSTVYRPATVQSFKSAPNTYNKI
jgi:hypothetical protein